MAKMICTACGEQAGTVTVTRGSLLIEIILWLCFIVPGLIYSIWRQGSKFQACRVCRSADVIPVNSKLGRRMVSMDAAPDVAPSAQGFDAADLQMTAERFKKKR